jgi:hypothetical protein
MWLLLEGWLLRNVLALLGWLAAAAAVAAVLFGARQAGRTAERIANMRRTVEVQHDQLEAASRRPRDRGELARRMRDGSSNGAPCPPVVAYSREFLAHAADELDVLPPGSAIEEMLADYQTMRDQVRACERFGE